jgi:PEP-CTERM motif
VSSLVLTVLSDVSYNPGAFNGPEFTALSGNPFGNVVSVSSPAGQPVAAHISGGVLFVNWQGDSFLANDTITITFGGVPEPSTWAMMLFGFVSLGFAFRQSRRKVSLA